ncbi:MAG: hypothetical protein ACRDP3_05250 [Streptomyces sp.]|uniref:hypothetical protein n=1 Tax=Streptomyces sp. TaxID=1931 RepID=UPI003D6AC165
MLESVPPSTVSRAIDDPRTQSAHLATWRRGLIRLVTWTVVWALLTLAVILINDRDLETVRAVFLLLMFVSLRPLALSAIAMQTVRSIDMALGKHPWQYCPAVRRAQGVKMSGGITVQIKLGDGEDGRTSVLKTGVGEDGWSPVMKARAPFRWRRWTKELESGAWFAGDAKSGGVLAPPGGKALTLVTPK